MKKFNAIAIGAGQAGPSLAEKLAREGLHTTIIERLAQAGQAQLERPVF